MGVQEISAEDVVVADRGRHRFEFHTNASRKTELLADRLDVLQHLDRD
jgi:hypothetical protein